MHAAAAPAPQPIPLFITEVEAMGGAERSLLALGRWLHAHGRPVYLLTYVDHIGLSQQAGFPFPTVALHPGPGIRSRTAALRAHLATRPGAPPPLTSGYQPALHCALARTGRFHCLMHDTPSLFAPAAPSLPQRLRTAVSNWKIGRAMRRNGGVMIVTSQYLQAECRRDFGLHAAIARMGGLGQQHAFRPRPLTGTPPPRLHLLSVSRIESNKRINWLLDALASLEHAAPMPLSQQADWSLDIAGKGSQLESMTARAQELGLANRVHLRGFVSDTALEALYNQAHLFLMPAVQGYGIPAVEALSRGIPVVLHRDSGVSDILLNTPWASVVQGGPEDLTARLGAMVRWLLEGGPAHAPVPPHLPTEETWARRVATLCKYV